MKLSHFHRYKPILSKYLTFHTRDILYECKCGKREIRRISRDFGDPFPIDTVTMVTNKEMKRALEEGLCEKCNTRTKMEDKEICHVCLYETNNTKP